MQDASDFSLRIVVMAPERRVLADEHATTVPFVRAPLPGVDLRPAEQRTQLIRMAAAPAEPEPLPPARHAWLPAHSGRQPTPSRIKARSLLGVPSPPPTRASPLSDDEERRMLRRARRLRRIAWAQRLLARFQFSGPAAAAAEGA